MKIFRASLCIIYNPELSGFVDQTTVSSTLASLGGYRAKPRQDFVIFADVSLTAYSLSKQTKLQ